VQRLIDLYHRDKRPGEPPEEFLARAEIGSLLSDLETLDQPRPEDFIDLGEDKAFEVKLSEGECAA
jgi:hypothetical protein